MSLKETRHCFQIFATHRDSAGTAVTVAQPSSENVWIDQKIDFRKLQCACNRNGKPCGAIVKVDTTLDHLSGGRFQLGIGRGISPHELQYFGADPALGQAMYVEAFQVILKALTRDVVDHEGEYYKYRNVPVELHPLQRPHPPLWYGIGNPESVDWCVRHRVNVVTNAPFDLMRRISDGYREAWSRAGHSPASLPCIGSSRHVVIADTDAEAERIARRAYTRWRASFMHLFKKHNASPRFVVFTEDFDEMRRGHVVIAGTAATVRDEMRHVTEATGLNYVLCRFAFGDMTLEESMRSTEQFATQVMPAFAA